MQNQLQLNFLFSICALSYKETMKLFIASQRNELNELERWVKYPILAKLHLSGLRKAAQDGTMQVENPDEYLIKISQAELMLDDPEGTQKQIRAYRNELDKLESSLSKEK